MTGGANGIGKACARRFANEGCKVIIADFDKKSGKKAEKQLRKQCKNKDVRFYFVDIAREKSIKKCM